MTGDDADAMQDATPATDRTPPDAMPLSLSDAAVRLGISPDAARKRLERGTLHGEKRGGRWLVYLQPDATASQVDASSYRTLDATPDASAASIGRHRTPPDAADSDSADMAPEEPVNIAPLVELVADLTRQNADLAAAAALWQERARFLGERLAALEAGPRTPASETPKTAHAPVDAQEGPQSGDALQMTPDTLQGPFMAPDSAEATPATGWRRWLRRVMGHDV